jgi:hypothetical protein
MTAQAAGTDRCTADARAIAGPLAALSITASLERSACLAGCLQVNAEGVFRYAYIPWFAQALQVLALSGVHGVAVDVWVSDMTMHRLQCLHTRSATRAISSATAAAALASTATHRQVLLPACRPERTTGFWKLISIQSLYCRSRRTSSAALLGIAAVLVLRMLARLLQLHQMLDIASYTAQVDVQLCAAGLAHGAHHLACCLTSIDRCSAHRQCLCF